MKHFASCAGALSLVALWAVSAPAETDPLKAYQRGAAAFRAGNLAGAFAALSDSLSADPEAPAARLLMGQICQRLFEQRGLFYEEAVENYAAVVSSLDDSVPASSPWQLSRYFLAELLILGGEYRKAVEHLKEFLRLQPDYATRESVWNCLGVSYYYLNEYEESVRAFEFALKVDPFHSPARFNLRSVFTRLSLFDLAMADRRTGRLDLALGDLDNLLSIAPRYGPAHLQRAILLRELNRPGEAEFAALGSLTLELGPKVSFGLQELLGDLSAARGDRERALELYRKCLQLFPGYLQVVEKMNDLERQAPAASSPKESRQEETIHTPTGEFPL